MSKILSVSTPSLDRIPFRQILRLLELSLLRQSGLFNQFHEFGQRECRRSFLYLGLSKSFRPMHKPRSLRYVSVRKTFKPI